MTSWVFCFWQNRSVDSSWVVCALKSDKTQEIRAAHKKKLWQLHLRMGHKRQRTMSTRFHQCVISDPNLFCHRRHTFALAKPLGRSRVNVKVHQSLVQSQDILAQLLLSCPHMAWNCACTLLHFYPHSTCLIAHPIKCNTIYKCKVCNIHDQ